PARRVGVAVVVLSLRHELTIHRRHRHFPGVDDLHPETRAVGDAVAVEIESPLGRLLVSEVDEIIFAGAAADVGLPPLVDGLDTAGRTLLQNLSEKRQALRALAFQHATLPEPDRLAWVA